MFPGKSGFGPFPGITTFPMSAGNVQFVVILLMPAFALSSEQLSAG
jgi:hypothetical protein